ncbi:alpha/beta hydrolase [Promicromonospora panici]|uniref:alpha/beta hydrolase n=1 Tax=Promicromonospora panici TaxID=2219658 RepID=UPI00101D3BD6|nr:alpha/beta hydrolase [Promicromonospora panici]
MTRAGLHVTRTEARGIRRGTVVAVHGIMESGPTLQAAADAWAARGWEVLAPDLRGHGRSPRWGPDDQLHPGDRLTEDLLAVLDDLPEGSEAGPGARAQEPLVLFGHSAGGGVVTAAAAQRPGRVAGVLLEDPFWRLPVTPHQDRAVAEQACRDLLARRARSLVELEADGAVAHPGWDPRELPAWARAQHDADPALVRNGDVIPTLPWPDLVRRLTTGGVDVLVITGAISPEVGMTARHRRMLAGCGARLAVIDGASHFVRRDAPERFATVAAEFLTRVARVQGTGREAVP